MKKGKVSSLTVGSVETNCYLLKNTETNETLIVDPGDSADEIDAKIKETEGKPVAILLTHGHFDHMLAARELADRYDIPICAYEKEQALLQDASLNLSNWGGGEYTLTADRLFTDGEYVKLAGFDFTVMHTPGHTAGSCCYYFPEEQMLFSGDTLFCGSFGRSDLPTSSYMDLTQSLYKLFMVLPEKTVVYTGHEMPTIIEFEKRFNPIV